jgi:hypothetical protein
MRALLLLMLAGCTNTHYTPQVLARGELVLRNRSGLEMHAGGRRVARGIKWNGLGEFVRCVPQAHEHATRAHKSGRASLALAVVGGTLGVIALGGLVGFADDNHLWEWLASGISVGVVGAIFSGTSQLLRNRANGQAVDAMNYYNDAVGSLGATCDDLVYPPAAGPAPSPSP